MTGRANWAGNYEFTAPEILEPTSIDEVQAGVRESRRVHALGTRHSFSDLADGPDTLISTVALPADPQLDESARTVTVGAGTRYGILARWLEERGWALHNLGSLPHISIGGAISTGTHGSGNANGVLSTAVAALEFVDARGELVRIAHGDPGFEGLVVGLGAFGIVVRVTLDIQPSYRVRQDFYAGVSWDAFLADPDAVTGAAYSVSVFTLWSGPTVGQVLVKSRLGSDLDGVPETLLDGRRSGTTSDFIVPAVADSLTPIDGTPGPWSERLPHFRLDAVPSVGDELQSEYFVRRSDAAAALAAIRVLADRIDPHLHVTELRTASADELWLSGAYRRDVLGIHFTWRKHIPEVLALLPTIEAALSPYEARPHWGKVHLVEADDLARVHPRLADAGRLFAELDPERRFVNAHLERLGLR
jgi:xylitol oxidase